MPTSPLLGIGLAFAELPQAITKGRQEGTKQFNAEQDRKENRANARQRRDIGALRLRALGREEDLAVKNSTAKQDALEAELHATTQQNRALSKKIMRKDSFRAIDNFLDSGDPKSINTFFKEHPEATQLFDNTLRVEKLNLANEEDRNLIRQMGVSEEELDAVDGKSDGKIDWDKLKRRYVKTIHTDGSVSASDVLNKAATMGYGEYADEKRLARLKKLADIYKTQKGNTITPTAESRNASQLAGARIRAKAGTGTAEDRAFLDLIQTKLGGTKAGREGFVDKARTKLLDLKFNNMSFEEMHSNQEVRKHINTIELQHELSEPQKKELLDLNAMVALSSEAGQLDEAQTGLWDRMTNNVTSYTNDQIGGKQNRAAYGAFINQFRHNLFGSALTDGELAAFKEAYGGLGQKTGPVLAGLRAALIQVKSKLNTISELGDPDVAKFRMGKSLSEVNSSLANIDKRIEFYDKVAAGATPEEANVEVFGTPEAPVSTASDIDSALGFGVN